MQSAARTKWACRRGMLELDVILLPFFEECFEDLNNEDKQKFIDLLECDDPDLFAWIMGHNEPRAEHHAMITKVIDHNLQKLR